MSKELKMILSSGGKGAYSTNDMENYSEILLKRIGKIEHVAGLHSSFVIKEYDVLNCHGLLNKV